MTGLTVTMLTLVNFFCFRYIINLICKFRGIKLGISTEPKGPTHPSEIVILV